MGIGSFVGVDFIRFFEKEAGYRNFEEAEVAVLGNAGYFCIYTAFPLLDGRVLCNLEWIWSDSGECCFAFCN